MRMKLFFSGRPSEVKYSGLPLRTWRKPVCSLPSMVKAAARTAPVFSSSPSTHIWSTTTLKRSSASRSESKSMSYLKISSVIWSRCAPLSPSLRAERNSEPPTLPLSTTVRTSTSRLSTVSRTASPVSSSCMRWPSPRTKRSARSLPLTGRSTDSWVLGVTWPIAAFAPGCASTRCRSAAGMPSCSNRCLSEAPRRTVTACQLSPRLPFCRASDSGGSFSDRVWMGVAGVGCSTVSKPGTMVPSRPTMVATKLACAHWRRVQRPLKP